MTLPPRPRRRPRVHLDLDSLESRALLSTVPAFARFEGRLDGPAESVAVRIRPADFGFGIGGRVVLRFDVSAGRGGTLDPGPVNVTSITPGGAFILSRRPNVPGGTASVTLASVRPGALAIRPTAQADTTGDFTVDVSLAGDVNGDFRVDRADLLAIRRAFGHRTGSPGGAPGVDVNRDGRVGALDLAIAAINLRASTTVRPLNVDLGIDPTDDPDGDGRVDASEVDVVGKTAPGTTVRLDRGADGSFEATATAGGDGRYRFTVPLTPGSNPIAVQASDAFGQTTSTQIAVTRGAPAVPVSVSFDFTQGAQGWVAGFADLPAAPNASYELDAGLRDLPPDLGVNGTGYLLQSHNRSDDVFMYLKRHLGAADGVIANQAYRVDFTIQFASNAPSGAFGAGGAPGESVILKAGADPVEPIPVDNGGFVRLNVDIGDQTTGGPAASVAGNIANGIEAGSSDEIPYISLTRQHTHTFTARADANGNLWLLVGTDSGFEGLTALYYQRIDVRLVPVAV